jgi:hypothetical protein
MRVAFGVPEPMPERKVNVLKVPKQETGNKVVFLTTFGDKDDNFFLF